MHNSITTDPLKKETLLKYSHKGNYDMRNVFYFITHFITKSFYSEWREWHSGEEPAGPTGTSLDPKQNPFLEIHS
jgi:hypothetical protein